MNSVSIALVLSLFFCSTVFGQTFADEILGPETPEQKKAAQAYQTAEFECRRSLESSAQNAIAKCEDAVAVARQLAPQRRIERSEVLSMLTEALIISGRSAEALPKIKEAIEIRSSGSAGRDNEGVASLFEMEAITYYSLQDFSKGNASMEAAIKSYEGAIERLPSMKSSYSRRLQTTLRRYAEIRKAMGNSEAAATLRSRADDLAPAIEMAPAPPVEQFRILDGVRLMGATGSFLTEDDLKKIRALVPSGAPPIWMIIGNRVGSYSTLDWQIEVYLQSEYTSENLRVGRLLTLSADLPAAGQFSATKIWKQTVVPYRYGQDKRGGREFQDVRSEKDLDRPFKIVELGNEEKFSNDDIARVIGFIRTQGAAASVGGTPRLSTDVQPWTIQELMRWSVNEAEVVLVNPNGTGYQTVRMRFGKDGVSILQMMR